MRLSHATALALEWGRRGLLALACLVLVSGVATAQSSITGVVRDQSGGVLPGATVEVTSPALIEGARIAVSDGQGRYRVIDLRPGTYRLTFSLAGFGTVVREGVELPSDFTATINMQLSVGALEETVTVTGATPIIDVEQATRTQVLQRDVLDSIPSARTAALRGALLPGIRLTTPDVGGTRSPLNTRMQGFGMHDSNTTSQLDGFQVNSLGGSGGNLGYISEASIQEVSVTSHAQAAEVSGGGIRVNNIPRDGGNTFSGDVFLGGSDGDWQSSNIDPAKHKNVQAPAGIAHVQNFSGSVGGPILREKLWFYSTGRHASTSEEVINAFFADGTPVTNDNSVSNASTRFTYQVNDRNKVAASLDRIFKRRPRIISVGTDPKAAGTRTPKHGNYNFAQAKWTSTLSSRVLIEGGYAHYQEDYSTTPFPEATFPRGTAEWLANARRQNNTIMAVPGCELPDGCNVWGTYGQTSYNLSKRRVLSASASYVTGSHSAKVGVQWGFGKGRDSGDREADLIQRYRNGRPIEVQIFNTPIHWSEEMNYDLGIYFQDTWTMDRLTLSPGIRIESYNASLPETWMPAGRFVPARLFPAQENLPNWPGDIAPRLGVAFDLFGNGRTAIKGNISRYYEQWVNFAGRYNLVQNSSSVFAWQDLNGDDIAQEPEFINNRGSNANFGLPVPVRAPDPNIKRAYNMEYSVQVSHELLPRVAITGGYFRRYWKDVENSTNTLVTRDDWVNSVVFQKENPLVPGHILNVYELRRALRGQSFTLDYTDETYRAEYDGIELSWNARWSSGATVFGGFSTERHVTVDCSAAEDPNAAGSDKYRGYTIARGLQTGPDGERWCDQRELGMPWRHEFKLAGTVPLPYDVQIGANLQSYPGHEYSYIWRLESFDFPGRSRVGTEQRLLLTQPGTLYYPRYNQLDLSFQKVFRYGSKRFVGQVDLFNALNASPILEKDTDVVVSRTGQVNPRLDDVTDVLQARLMRLAFQMTF